MRILLKPAFFLLDYLKYAYKFLLIGILVFIPLGVTLYYLTIELNEGHEFAYDERTGVAYNLGLQRVMSAVDNHRRLVSPDQYGEDQREAAEEAVERSIGQMDAINDELGTRLEASDRWEAVKQQWTDLQNAQAGSNPDQALRLHHSILEEGIALISHVGDTSKLILDPDLDSYYLMDATVIRLPLLAKQIGDARDLARTMPYNAALSRPELTDLMARKAGFQIAVDGIGAGYQVIIEQNPALRDTLEPSIKQFQASMEKFLTSLQDGYIRNDTVTAEYDLYALAAQEAVNAANALYVTDSRHLDALIQTRETRYEQIRTFVIAFVTALSLIVLYMFVGFYSSITGAIRLLLQSMGEVAQGKLQTRMKVRSRDEMETAARSFNRMTAEIRTLIGASKSNADQAAATSASVADIARESTRSNERLTVSIEETAQGAGFQLQSTLDSAKAMTEMAEGIGRIAVSTSSALQVSLDSAEQAAHGKITLDRVFAQMTAIQQSVNETALSIGQLDEFAQQVGRMVELIKGLAYKSNILALNASIEAVRAGEHGKGFAVVANETRKMAESSASSAEGIADVLDRIQTTSQQSVLAMSRMRQEVLLGNEAVQEAGNIFREIVSSTRGIAVQMEEISAAAEQMSASSEQVSASIQQISDTARGSSEQADRMNDLSASQSASMNRLSEQAALLKDLSHSLQRQIEKFTIA